MPFGSRSFCTVRHKKDWQNKKGIGGPGGSNKIIVAGAIQRGGKVRMQVVPTVDADVLRAFLKAKIADEARAVCTDEHYAYRNIIEDANTQHAVVKHSAGQYVFGDVHTNTMENVWSLFTKGTSGNALSGLICVSRSFWRRPQLE